jgi:hypothetical protein
MHGKGLTGVSLRVQGMDGKLGSMCTDTAIFQGKKTGCAPNLACEPMIGPLLHSGYGYCTDLNIGKFGMTGAMRATLVAQRRTTAGVPCRLPLFYKCARPPPPLPQCPPPACEPGPVERQRSCRPSAHCAPVGACTAELT